MFVYFFFYVLLFSSCLSLSVSLSAHSLKLSSLCLTFSQAHSLKLSPLYFTAAGPTHCPTASLASWQRRNLTIKKRPTQSLYFSFLSLTSPLLSANYRHHLSMRDPSMEALFNTRFQRKSNPVPLSSLNLLPSKKYNKKKPCCENNFPNLWILIIVKYNNIKIWRQTKKSGASDLWIRIIALKSGFES